jgi:SAM-dependent methyltransferase
MEIWYQQKVAQKLIEAEKEAFAKILPRLYGYHLVFLGEAALASLVETSLISHRVFIHPHTMAPSLSTLKGSNEALPFLTDSVDVVVLPHVLEHAIHPHQVLRETHRILIPEGHLVITGFNPLSCWGGWHAYQHLRGKTPSGGKMLTLGRLRDWLTLLDFRIVGATKFYFRPPIAHEAIHRKMYFLEKWGEVCWPFLGGAYILLAVKRVVSFTPIRPRFKNQSRLWQGNENLPKPTTTTK